jgi:hypothetical protein
MVVQLPPNGASVPARHHIAKYCLSVEETKMKMSKTCVFPLMRCFTFAAIGAAVLLSAPGAEAQGGRQACGEYARDAVEQNEANERRKCGFEGPRWSSNEGAHLAWCLISPGGAEREAAARREQLQGCREDRREERREGREERREERRDGKREGKRANCDTYAKIAVAQAEANQKYECGYRGGEWATREAPHFQWCMKSRRSYLGDELRFRTGELQKCFDKLGDYDDEGNDREYRRRRF